MCTYLHGPRQGGTYYFRMSILAALRAHFGKREFYFSLRTKDPVEAKRRVLLIEAPRHVALVEQAEAELAGQQCREASACISASRSIRGHDPWAV